MSATIEIEANGFGASYQCILYGFALCKNKGWDYRHTPWKCIHNTDYKKCNDFIGFNKFSKPDKDTINLSYTPELYDTPVDDLFSKETLQEIKECYYSTSKPNNPYNGYVAVHIRRGDVNKSKHPDRWISNEQYKKWIVELLRIYPNYKILIISLGKPEEFKELTGLDARVVLDLEQDALRHFNIMVEADVLFPTLSSLSFTAGILNENFVHKDVYEKFDFWHTPSSYCLSILHYVNIS